MEFQAFCRSVEPEYPVMVSVTTVLSFANQSGNVFHITEPEIRLFLRRWSEQIDQIVSAIESHHEFDTSKSVWTYQEKPYRHAIGSFFADSGLRGIVTLGASQTRGMLFLISKYVGFHLGNTACRSGDNLLLDKASVDAVLAHVRLTG